MSYSLNAQNTLLIVLGFFAAVGFMVWMYRYTTRLLSTPAGWSLLLLRIAAVVLLFLILCEPVVSLLTSHTEPAKVVLLVDTSSSMGLSDRFGNRQETLRQFLSSETIQTLRDRYRVETYQFAETVTPLAPSTFDSVAVVNAATDIGAGLEFVRTRSRVDSVAGVILITDGNHTVGRDPLRVADGMRIPVYTVGIGDTLEVRDTGIVHHITNDVAYVNSRIPVEVTLRSQGISPVRIPVTLSEDDRPVDTGYVELAGDGREQAVTLYVSPAAEGVRRYRLDIPVQPGELTPHNNQRDFSIKVLKAQLRVLYLEGSPRPDIAFLKRALERDRNIEVASILLRPDGSTYPPAITDSRSEWFGYDLIILGSVDAARVRRWERHIVDFVEQKGGGLIVLGGSHSFDLGGYTGTPVGNLLPIRLASTGRGFFESQFVPVLTPDGQIHPLMKLGDDAVTSGKRWAELPPLPGINLAGPAKPGATVLAIHPTWQIDGVSAPVIAVQRYGLGKVLAITAHELWRWDLMMWGTGGTNANYQRFWSNAVRWLTTYEGGQRTRVTTEETHYQGGEPVVLQGQVYDENYYPVDDASIQVIMASRKPEIAPVQIALSPSATGNGRYSGSVRFLPGGSYTFTARAMRNGVEIGSSAGEFTVGETTLEFLQTRMNRDTLGRLSAMTGGRFYMADQAHRLSADATFPETVTPVGQNVQLWHHPLVFILFVAFISAEWLLRRHYGLQ